MAVVRKLKRILEARFPPPDKVDLRDQGAIVFFSEHEHNEVPEGTALLTATELAGLEPCLSANGGVARLQERSVDPRALARASFHAARHHNVDVASGSQVTEVRREGARIVVGAVGASETCLIAIVTACSASNGTRPVSIS